jgi:hypothetical protein
MTDETRIEDLTADQIGKLLMQDGGQMGKHVAAALKEFVQEVGGLENALAAIAMLGRLEAEA